MGDHLYIWHNPVEQYVVASGLEFRQIASRLTDIGGLVTPMYSAWLLDHGEMDESNRLSYIPAPYISELAAEDLYSLGDFCWVDYAGAVFPSLCDQEVAELLFFAHLGRPLERVRLSNLNNKFLCYLHDDGWYLRLYYFFWSDVVTLLDGLHPCLDLCALEAGDHAHWIQGDHFLLEEKSDDVDAILSRRYLR